MCGIVRSLSRVLSSKYSLILMISCVLKGKKEMRKRLNARLNAESLYVPLFPLRLLISHFFNSLFIYSALLTKFHSSFLDRISPSLIFSLEPSLSISLGRLSFVSLRLSLSPSLGGPSPL